jgi:hypothetical protein
MGIGSARYWREIPQRYRYEAQTTFDNRISLLLTVWLSFQDWSTQTPFGTASFIGLDNFRDIFGSTSIGRDFKGALINVARQPGTATLPGAGRNASMRLKLTRWVTTWKSAKPVPPRVEANTRNVPAVCPAVTKARNASGVSSALMVLPPVVGTITHENLPGAPLAENSCSAPAKIGTLFGSTTTMTDMGTEDGHPLQAPSRSSPTANTVLPIERLFTSSDTGSGSRGLRRNYFCPMLGAQCWCHMHPAPEPSTEH